jgi:DNA helicase HerA-like ATPase
VFRSGVLGGAGETTNTRALIFNVKGEDLLFLDHPNARLDADTRSAYARLGLDAGPFPDVCVYAPPRAGDRTGAPDVASRLTGVEPFYWTLAEFCADRLLPYVFADADDDRQQYTMVVHSVAAHLHRHAVPADGGVVIEGARVGSYEDLVDLISERLSDEDTRGDWAGSAVGLGTVNAFLRRLISSKRDLSRLIRGDLPTKKRHGINTAESAQVTIVDLHNLPDRGQRFVVGVILKSEFDRKERAGTAKPLLFVVLDELNKYAPRDGTSPIKEVLLDIAERGRSLGVVLIGAQQTASEVERRILVNSAIKVVGRLDAAEVTRPEYGFLPAAQAKRALIAKPGTMFINQPDIPVPLVAEFPFPSWATRPSEAGPAPSATLRSMVQSSDPFAVVGAARGGKNGDTVADDDIPF